MQTLNKTTREALDETSTAEDFMAAIGQLNQAKHNLRDANAQIKIVKAANPCFAQATAARKEIRELRTVLNLK